MLNPGTYPSRQYMSLGDMVLAYEGSYARYTDLRVPGWVQRVSGRPVLRTWFTPPRARAWPRRSGLSQRRHAGYVYVTDKAGRNPYGALPGYWAARGRDHPRPDAPVPVRRAGPRRLALAADLVHRGADGEPGHTYARVCAGQGGA